MNRQSSRRQQHHFYLLYAEGLLRATDSDFSCFNSRSKNIFKLVEEETLALLLHLLKVFAETAVLTLASVLGCRLVVESPQAIVVKTGLF
jgi:hypothetical protein